MKPICIAALLRACSSPSPRGASIAATSSGRRLSMSSRQTGVRSLSITAARTPSRSSPSLAARAVKRYSRVSAFSTPGSRRAARTSSSVQAIDSGHCRRRVFRMPWPQSLASSRATSAARSAASKASSISSRRGGERRLRGRRLEVGDRRPGRRSRRARRTSSGQRLSGTKWSAKPARMASPAPMRWPVRPRYSPSRPSARARIEVAPMSGMRPIMHSGIASWVRLADDAVAGMAGEADAAAHDEAVHQHDDGLREAGDPGVHPVLVGPEAPALARSRRGDR